jgi:DHA1 family multidrug resistance protein-like MFS transporter
MASIAMTPEPTSNQALIRRPAVYRLLIIALLAEISYAVLNISTMTVYLRDDRQFGESVVGLVLVAFLFSEAVFKSPMGHLADRFGPRLFMFLGPLMSVGTSLLSLAVPHSSGHPAEVLVFIALRAVDGLGAAMLWPAAFSAINDAVEDDERQQAMSLLNLCYMLGVAVAFPLGGAVNDISHVKWAGLILASVIFACVAVSVWRFIPRGRTHTHGKTASDGAATDVGHGEGGLRDFFNCIKQIPGYLLLAVIIFAGIGFPMAIFKLFPADEFRFSETQIGFLILPAAGALAALSVPMSKFGERIGRVKAVHLGIGLCFGGMAVISSGMFLPFLRQPWILAVGGIPVGVGFLLTIPAWMASVSDIDPQRRGTNIGAVMTAQGLGAIIGAPIGSALYEKLQPVGIHLGLGPDFGRYSPFFGCTICLLAGWLIGMRILKEPK